MARFGSLTDAPASFVLVGARVIDPAGRADGVADLAVIDGRIVAPAAVPDGTPRIDAAGLLAAPAFCDTSRA